MASILPRFNSRRMVSEYFTKCYMPASKQYHLYRENNCENSGIIAAWKNRIRNAWPEVTLRRLDAEQKEIRYGESLHLDVAVGLNGLDPGDIILEMLLGLQTQKEKLEGSARYRFEATGNMTETGENVFTLEVQPDRCGKLEYFIRAFPHHRMMTHPFEMGMMRWL